MANGQPRMKYLRAGLLGLVMIGLAACGSDSQESADGTAASPKTAARPVDDATATMARAVGSGKPGAAVDIRYEFKGKPAVGTPMDLVIAIIPSVGVDAMDAKISGMDGVGVTGAQMLNFAEVAPGKAYTHRVTLLPDRSGVFYVTVTVTTQIGNSSLGRTYSIPFVVGSAQAAQKPAPAKDANGQAIESMPAQESGG
jgi:hypothetical protein